MSFYLKTPQPSIIGNFFMGLSVICLLTFFIMLLAGFVYLLFKFHIIAYVFAAFWFFIICSAIGDSM